MRRRSTPWWLMALVVGCAAPAPTGRDPGAGREAATSANASSPAPEAPPEPPSPATPVATAPSPQATQHSGDEAERVTLLFEGRLAVRCNAKQTNTPCIYPTGATCKLREGNCDLKPCDEGPHETVPCDQWVAARNERTKVCLELRGFSPGVVMATGDAGREPNSGTGPLTENVARFCGEADRVWRADIEDRGHRWSAELDWSKATCVVLDFTARQSGGACTEPFPFTPYENRL